MTTQLADADTVVETDTPKVSKARARRILVAGNLRRVFDTEVKASEEIVGLLTADGTAAGELFSAANMKAKDNAHAPTANSINRCLVSWGKRLGKLGERVEKAERAAVKGAPEPKAGGWVRITDDERFPLTTDAADILKSARSGHRGNDTLILTTVTTVTASAVLAALRSGIPSFGSPDCPAVSYTLAGKQTRVRARAVTNGDAVEIHLSLVR